MRKDHFGKKLMRRIAALALAAVMLTGAAVTVSAEGLAEYYQKALLYGMLGDSDAGVRYFDQEVQKDPENPAVYLGRAQVRQMLGDLSGARQDCDQAISRLSGDWTADDADVQIYAYAARANVDFLQGDQAQYLSDMGTHLGVLNKLTQYGMFDPDWFQMLQRAGSTQADITSWYNNGSPAKSFQTTNASVTGGAGDTSIHIVETWDADNPDLYTYYDTTFQLSQPVRRVARRGGLSSYGYGLMEEDENGNGAVVFVVPAGTTITMNQYFQSGRGRAQNYQSFSVSRYLMDDDEWTGTSLTVEAGKSYYVDFAGGDGIQVYFTAE